VFLNNIGLLSTSPEFGDSLPLHSFGAGFYFVGDSSFLGQAAELKLFDFSFFQKLLVQYH